MTSFLARSCAGFAAPRSQVVVAWPRRVVDSGPVRVVGILLWVAACGRMGFDENLEQGARICDVGTQLPMPGDYASQTGRIFDETVMAGHIYRVSGRLLDDPAIRIRIELWDGYGAFAGATARTGSFAIGGDDASAASCGVCAYVEKSSASLTMFAVGGNVEVTELGSSLAATLEDLELVQIDPATSQVPTDACVHTLTTTTLASTLSTSTEGISDGGHGGDGAGHDDDDDD